MDLASPHHKIPAVNLLDEPTHDPRDHFEVPVNIPVKIISQITINFFGSTKEKPITIYGFCI
jgi:hypothetical protein